MSKVVKIALPIIGGIVGGMFGMPQVGYAVGGYLGGASYGGGVSGGLMGAAGSVAGSSASAYLGGLGGGGDTAMGEGIGGASSDLLGGATFDAAGGMAAQAGDMFGTGFGSTTFGAGQQLSSLGSGLGGVSGAGIDYSGLQFDAAGNPVSSYAPDGGPGDGGYGSSPAGFGDTTSFMANRVPMSAGLEGAGAIAPSAGMSPLEQLLQKLGLGKSGPPATPSSGAGDWAKRALSIGSGLYSMYQANQTRKAMAPFDRYRGQYGADLQALERNPASITSRPGYQAGLQAVQRAGAAQGFTGSGNMAASLANFGQGFYQNEVNRLATLAGAGTAPGAGYTAGTSAMGSGLASIGYGLADYGQVNSNMRDPNKALRGGY